MVKPSSLMGESRLHRVVFRAGPDMTYKFETWHNYEPGEQAVEVRIGTLARCTYSACVASVGRTAQASITMTQRSFERAKWAFFVY